jgi:hypothetical protein
MFKVYLHAQLKLCNAVKVIIAHAGFECDRNPTQHQFRHRAEVSCACRCPGHLLGHAHVRTCTIKVQNHTSFTGVPKRMRLRRRPKHLGPVQPAVATHSRCSAHVHMIAQDVCAMSWAVHPCIKNTPSAGLTSGNVLSAATPPVPGTCHAGAKV